ncbi:chromosome segregation protein [Secundilactobacillus pentosiphilus]|uniref:Chromosome segregation protein n=1 Tax=Secundilactobacillus pentosiphilus TaxID=1714682 RepID=A0A1Z5IUI3_9LACO|nr:AAA family ATPase [Secundilactobacillus pentosiphilus]GAX05413.1 chromosome segregation protein [Secundilactobacillus pentosiphilus]
MKEIKLKTISYHNFKGIKDYTIDADGQNVTIAGENATGKTSSFDGFWWLLFGKNSSEASKFNPKPLDENGNEIIGLEPEVSAVLTVDGKEVKLSRKLAEVWSKPRNQVEKVRKSDKTELTVDNVPYKLTDYNKMVSDIIDEDNFKLLTNPMAFNNLKWTDRREILLKMVPDVDDEEIVSQTDHPDELRKILSDHTVDEQRKIVKAQRSDLKKKIDSLPARIDEANRAIPEVSTTSKETLEAMLKEYQSSLSAKQSDLQALNVSNDSLDARKRKSELQNELQSKQSAHMQGEQLALGTLANDVSDMQIKYNTLNGQVSEQQREVESLSTKLQTTSDYKQVLLSQYHEAKDQTFDDSQLVCPTCGQEFPSDKQAEIKEHYNTERAKKLEDVTTKGKQAAADIEQTTETLKAKQAELEQSQTELYEAQNRLTELKQELAEKKSKVAPFEETDIYHDLKAKIDACDIEIQQGNGGNQEAKQELQAKISKIQADIEQVQGEISNYDAADRQHERIKQLTSEEAELKDQYNNLDLQSFVLDEYVRTKVKVLEKRINDMFGLVTFKLFETQKNGEINDICEAMVDGVPYSTDLNNAARINAGLDIINTLSKQYQVSAPIFVDNAESVNNIIETESQQIRLAVSKDKQLTKVGD